MRRSEAQKERKDRARASMEFCNSREHLPDMSNSAERVPALDLAMTGPALAVEKGIVVILRVFCDKRNADPTAL